MPFLSREQFVNICTEAILNTRGKVAIGNQKSGYVKYHCEIKENDYFTKNVRTPLVATKEDDYMYRHDLIGHVGLGNCHELADYLLVEIGKEIMRQGAVARIRILNSLKYDHVYLEILIQLRGERNYSIWEVDAWDPRIIDISTRPDGSIKNYESLTYGYSADAHNSVYTDQINYNRRYTFFNAIPKPLAGGPPAGSATPERDMLEKHPTMYDDYTLEESMDAGMFDAAGDIHYLQKASNWQY
ncbi:hypothetical protein [Legionella sp. WA2022007384]